MTQINFSIDARSALAQLNQIATAAQRAETIRNGVRAGMAPVIDAARTRVQQPGKPDYTPRHGRRKAKKKLRDTIGQLTRIYQNHVVGVVGPQAPAGAHGHLVEGGHRIAVGGSVARKGQPAIKWRPGGPGRPPKHIFSKGAPRARRGITGGGRVIGQARAFPFMRPAWESVASRVESTMVAAMQEHVARAVAAGGSNG